MVKFRSVLLDQYNCKDDFTVKKERQPVFYLTGNLSQISIKNRNFSQRNWNFDKKSKRFSSQVEQKWTFCENQKFWVENWNFG